MATPTTTGLVSSVALSKGSWINALLEGFKWGDSTPGLPTTVSVSFPDYFSWWSQNYGVSGQLSEPHTGFAPLNVVQQNAANQALAAWSNVANILWQPVSETANLVGDIRIAFSQAVGLNSANTAWGYTYSAPQIKTNPMFGDVWIDSSNKPSSFSQGTEDFLALTHEIGHALGLKHPFEGSIQLPSDHDTQQYSIMSYTKPNLNWGGLFPSTPMPIDVATMQYLYGANMNYHAGDDVYKFDPAHPVVETIWDAGGTNTFDASAFSTQVTIDLIPGDFSSIGLQSNIAIAYHANIQNAVGGSGGNTIFGNALDNQITGGNGTDFLYGEAGNDTITPGQGHSWIDGGLGTNTVVFGSPLSSYHFVQDGNSLRVYGTNGSRAILSDVQQLTFSDGTVAVSDLAAHAPVASDTVRTGLVELYVSMFGRAPELTGFSYWEGQALDGNKSMVDLANVMFTLPAVQAIYPTAADQSSFINSIYQLVLGKAADPSGLTYWQGQLSSGATTRGGLIAQMVYAALHAPDGTPGKAFLANRMVAAETALELQEASGNGASPSDITQAFSGITSDANTVATALTTLQGLTADVPSGLLTGSTVTTTGVQFEGHSIQWIG